MTQSPVRGEGGQVWSTELTWTPDQAQYSTNIMCFQAVDNTGYVPPVNFF